MLSEKVSTLNLVIEDLKKVFKGFTSLIGYIITSDDKSPHSLSILSTATISAKAGQRSFYDAVVTNNTTVSSWFWLSFDIYKVNNSRNQNGHFSYYEKKIFVPAKESKTIRIIYDWFNKALFTIDGVTLQPDSYWQAGRTAQGKYIIITTLLTNQGVIINNLAIVQELSE